MLVAPWRLSSVCLAALALAACGGSGLSGGVYRDGRIAFRVGPVPGSWRPLEVEAATLAYRDEPHRASVLVNARCGRKDDDSPLVALTAHLLLGTTDREYGPQDTIPFDGREALHTRVRAKLDGVPMDYDVFVLKKDGCVYDLVYLAEPEPSPEAVASFERFVAGFHTLSSGSAGGPPVETKTPAPSSTPAELGGGR